VTKKSDVPPPPLLIKTERGLRPFRAWDGEDLAADPMGTVYEAVKTNKRSSKQLRTFWKALGLVVSATGRWPTKEKLCEELKFALGYRIKFKDWKTGAILERADSIALSKMKPDVFQAFFDQAMATLSEECGFDPLGFLEDQ
jgi:hypothetical protein